MTKYKKYEPGYVLKENEYMLKIRKGSPSTGFLTKKNKDGSVPVAFGSWGEGYGSTTKLPVHVFEEKFRSGWKLSSWRFGQSQNWATLIHPEGFTLEIYLDHFLDIVQENTIVEGVIQGNFMWKGNTLISERE